MSLGWRDYSACLRSFGFTGTIQLFASRKITRSILPKWTTRLRSRNCDHPVRFRHGTSDKYAIIEVLGHEQYAQLLGMDDVRFIVDAGANIGTASVYLLSAYPNARLLSLEPDPGNYAALKTNLAPYGERATALQQALWSKCEGLAISRGGFRDGAEWSYQVNRCDGVSEVSGTTLAQLMITYQLPAIDILKVDIEGAETFVFEAIDPAVLMRIRTIAIELHDADARRTFLHAVSPIGKQTSQTGEVTHWLNPLFSSQNHTAEVSLGVAAP